MKFLSRKTRTNFDLLIEADIHQSTIKPILSKPNLRTREHNEITY
ncbi:hypothetical protein APA_3063 [Pseudanabaena sp. lw0831]|nr:hypothetical protein APA_3063 [Pseudanabaena sp. lw0831]